MGPSQLNILVGWAAILSAVATLLTLITGYLFFSTGGMFGPVSDPASAFRMLLMLPIAGALYLLTSQATAALALVATAIGVAGMLITAVLQALLVFRAIEYEQTLAAPRVSGSSWPIFSPGRPGPCRAVWPSPAWSPALDTSFSSSAFVWAAGDILFFVEAPVLRRLGTWSGVRRWGLFSCQAGSPSRDAAGEARTWRRRADIEATLSGAYLRCRWAEQGRIFCDS